MYAGYARCIFVYKLYLKFYIRHMQLRCGDFKFVTLVLPLFFALALSIRHFNSAITINIDSLNELATAMRKQQQCQGQTQTETTKKLVNCHVIDWHRRRTWQMCFAIYVTKVDTIFFIVILLLFFFFFVQLYETLSFQSTRALIKFKFEDIFSYD